MTRSGDTRILEQVTTSSWLPPLNLIGMGVRPAHSHPRLGYCGSSLAMAKKVRPITRNALPKYRPKEEASNPEADPTTNRSAARNRIPDFLPTGFYSSISLRETLYIGVTTRVNTAAPWEEEEEEVNSVYSQMYIGRVSVTISLSKGNPRRSTNTKRPSFRVRIRCIASRRVNTESPLVVRTLLLAG